MPRRHHERQAGRFRGQRGAALVEFALVMPLLFTLLLGIISGGRAYNSRLQLTQASREGARYGAVLPAGSILAAGATWATTVRDYLVERSAGELRVSPAVGTICVALVEGTGAGTTVVTSGVLPQSSFTTNGSSPCVANEPYSTTASDTGRRVQVVVTKPAKIETLFVGYDVTLSSAFTARQEFTA